MCPANRALMPMHVLELIMEGGHAGLWPWPMTVKSYQTCLHVLVFSRQQDPLGKYLVALETSEQGHIPKPVDPLRTWIFVRMLLNSLVAGSFDLSHLYFVMRDESPLGPLDGLLQRVVDGVPYARAVHPFVPDLDRPGEVFADESDVFGGLQEQAVPRMAVVCLGVVFARLYSEVERDSRKASGDVRVYRALSHNCNFTDVQVSSFSSISN